MLEKLGAGGMGEVFLGHDARLQRRVALKCLAPAASGAGDGHAGVLREARAAARLNHPHIASVYDVLEHDGRAFIVMEYVEGESLRARLSRGRLTVDEVIAIGRQLASALGAAHAQGVIHRDLKPSNVQMMPGGSVKVLDFGVAKIVPRVETMGGGLATTEAHSIAGSAAPGTPIYMAPEQLIAGRADERSDLYSLGVLLFEMVTGRRPYADTSAVALAVAMSTAPAPPSDAVVPRVPRALSAVIAKALQREPLDRYQSARELEAALAELTDPTTRNLVVVRRRAGAGWRWTLAIGAVVALAFGAVAWRPLLTRMGVLHVAPVVTRPVVLAILPVDNPGGDPQAGYLGAGIASVIAENLGSIPGLTVLSRASTAAYELKRNDLSGLQKELGADYVLDLALRTAAPRPQVVARLRRPDALAPVWEQTVDGDALVVEKALLEGVGRSLERSGALPRRLTSTEWNRILTLPTTSGDALMQYSQARALLDRWDVPGNIEGAIGLLERAAATDPGFALAHAALGDALWQKYQRERVAAIAERATAEVLEALRLDPGRAQVHYSLAVMYNQTGRLDNAIESLRRSIELQPDSDESHRQLGVIWAAKGDFNDAIAEMNQAIRIRPSFWSNYSGLGFVLYTAGRYEDALNAYRRATELQPTDARAFAMMGTMYHLLGRMDQAIGNYEHAVRLGPSRTAYSNLGLAYYASKRYAEALEAYKNAAVQDPNYPLTHRNIGDVYAKLGQDRNAGASYLKAIALGDEALKINPRDAATISLIATCEAKLGRRAAAERHAAEAVAIAPSSREALVRSAQVHARLNQPGAALKDLEAAIARGYDRRQAREEDEFAAIRNLPAFQKLVGDDGQLRKP